MATMDDISRSAARDLSPEFEKRLRKLDEAAIAQFIGDNAGRDRERLIADGYLLAGAPAKGSDLLREEHRSPEGEALLGKAKDVLVALLFGESKADADLKRVEQEVLALALPRAKAGALDFLRASTKQADAGTSHDPDSISSGERADNVLLEIQFGETADELVGRGIVAALSLINNLEVNEQDLSARTRGV